MAPEIGGFDWDDANRKKCQKHGVSLVAIESLFRRAIAVFPDSDHSGDEERFKAIGKTDAGRSVLIVFTLRVGGSARFIRPISARYMHTREIEYYEKEAARSS